MSMVPKTGASAEWSALYYSEQPQLIENYVAEAGSPKAPVTSIEPKTSSPKAPVASITALIKPIFECSGWDQLLASKEFDKNLPYNSKRVYVEPQERIIHIIRKDGIIEEVPFAHLARPDGSSPHLIVYSSVKPIKSFTSVFIPQVSPLATAIYVKEGRIDGCFGLGDRDKSKAMESVAEYPLAARHIVPRNALDEQLPKDLVEIVITYLPPVHNWV